MKKASFISTTESDAKDVHTRTGVGLSESFKIVQKHEENELRAETVEHLSRIADSLEAINTALRAGGGKYPEPLEAIAMALGYER